MKIKNLLLIFTLALFANSFAQVLPAYIPTNGLVGYWPFNGNAIDESVNTNDGTINGAVLTSDRFGSLNCAYDFYQTGHITLPSLNVSSITINAWVKRLPGPVAGQAIVSKHYSSSFTNSSYLLYHAETTGCNRPKIYYTNTANQPFSTTQSSITNCDDVWHMITGTVDNITTKIYFDGILMNSSNNGGTIKSTGFSTLIGNGYNNNGSLQSSFGGKIDDVGIWNRALTVCEIKELFLSGISSLTLTSNSTSICAGNTNTINISGAQTYTWLPGNLSGATVTVSPTTNTTYTVTGTDVNGCVSTTTTNITINSLPTLTATSTASIICAGFTNTLSVSGATTYTWLPGNLSGASVTVSPTSNTTYTVTGTNANGCSNTAVKTITVNALPTLTATTVSSAICIGSSNTLSVSGAQTYTWLPGNLSGASVTVSPTSNTTYTVTGTNTNGCKNTAIKTITVNPLPTLTASAISSAICTGNTNTLSVSGAQTYTWLPGNLSGSSVTVSPTSNTTYTVTGTNANGCTNTAVKTITVNALPTLTATTGSSSICIGSSNTLSVFGAQTYTWQPGNLSGASVTVSPIANTTYTVTGTNTNGCINTAIKTITVNALPTLTASAISSAICIGNTNTLSVSGAQTYTWLPGNLSGASVTVSPTSNTTYTVTGTNANGCTNTAVKTITVNALPTLSATTSSSAICIGNTTQLNVLGATTYTWLPGNLSGASVTVSPTSNTTYTVTGTNTNGCTNTAVKTITVNALPTLSATTGSSSICIGSTTQLNVLGATTYTWLPGNLNGASVTVSPTSNTTYTVIGQDVNGCLNISTETIIVNALPISNITLAGNDSICNGTSTTLLGSGGVTYNWSNGANTASNTVNATGIYTVIVTDINGCNDTSQISITVAPPIQINFNVTNPLCFGQNGSITYTTSGGIAPLNTQWLGSINPANVSVGTYSNLTTDGLGCQLNTTVAVTQPSQLQINATVNNVLCSGGQSGTATAIVNGGVLPYSYLWSNGNTTSIISAITAGVYTVQILDANNCSTNTVVTITQQAAISASVNVTAATCIGALDGIAQLNVNGGITPYSYAWSNGNTSAINTNLSAGNYSVMVSDANACTYTLSIIVNDGALPCFAVPGGFSPNGDGINDTWEIPGIDKYPNAVVTILNRWGQEIFNITNYATPWNGSYNGSVLPTADYYYIIKLDSNSKPLTGTVTIKR